MKRVISFLVVAVAACAILPVVAALKYGPDGYVQDGLVAHFDGLCNAGTGKAHDLFATNWVDLSANHNDAFLVDDAPGAGHWHADGYRFEGQNFFQLSKTIAITNTITVQVVCNVDTNELTVSYAHLVGAGDTDQCDIYWAKYTPPRLVFKNANGGHVHSTSLVWEGQYATAIRNGNLKRLFQTGDGSDELTVNGAQNNIGTQTWRIGAATSELSIRNSNRLTGKIQAVRIYDRALTTAELVANRALDDVHYKTGIPVTNAVVATSVRGVEGTEPSGVYAIDGSHTFTAPATVTLGPDTYSCAGYTLEEWDAAADAWGAPVLYGGVLAAEITETSPKVRLTWQWTHTAGPGALDVDAYAQDGLEMFFDGFRNAGRSAPHDPAATTWANLATANDAPITVGDTESKWKENGYFFGGGSYGQLVAQQTLGSNYTVQVACDVDTRELVAIRTAIGNALRWPHVFGAGATDCCNLYYHLEWNNNGNYPICFKDVTGARANLFSWAGRYITAVRDGRSFKASQGATMATSATGTAEEEKGAMPVGKQTWYIATAEGSGSNAKSVRYLTGTIHAIRLYGRVLTDAELAANHELDEARFWQRPTSNGMVIVSSRVEGLAGNEPNGAYRPVAYTFSAPTSTLTVGDKDYQLDGYVVETWDAVRQTWCVPEVGTGSSWTSPAGTDWASRRLTWKWKVVRGLKTYGTDDYVQEGLFLHLDGIRNKGADRPHDRRLTSWRDLSWRRGLANINQRMPDESAWLDNGYSFAGSNYVESVDSISPGSNITVDVLCNVNLATQKAQFPTFFSGYKNDAFVFFTRGTGTTLEWKQDEFAGGSRPKATNWKGRNFAGVLGNTQSIIYEDGLAKITQARAKNPAFNPSYWRLMCNGWDWLSNENKEKPLYNHQAIGTIHAARVYNRALSAAEVAWNHTVDAARYDGVLPVTNVVVAAGMYGASVELPGVYEVEGAWTFSATNAVENGKARRVVGYTVETWSNGAWGAPAKHEGASYSYAVGSSPAKVRLTWLWLKDGACVIVR